eukprot:829599-Pelagomonas_calceolata.AAC.6
MHACLPMPWHDAKPACMMPCKYMSAGLLLAEPCRISCRLHRHEGEVESAKPTHRAPLCCANVRAQPT